ncbi:50S ribosomal protein L23 [Patescibacteria group bacterium]|nr:50S ribosomal protein L23 [Patescibacteria group bacterium]
MQTSKLLILKPLISEKGTELANIDKYAFLVHSASNKKQIKEVLESIYKVDVVKVNIIRNRNKGESYKKAIITLKKGQTIDVGPH